MTAPAFAKAAEIEATLELLAERSGDPTPLVYERLFKMHPQMRAHFWRDERDAVKGEMLARTFEAILDFVGERRYAQHMLRTEMITHEGYDIPRDIFITFFGVVRDTARDVLGDDWTATFETAWADLLAEMQTYVATTPFAGATHPYYAQQIAAFEASYPAPAGNADG